MAVMSKSTISTFQLFEMFPTAESARLYLESRLWPESMTLECKRCYHMMQIREGEEPTDVCDHCAHEVLAKISDIVLAYRPKPKTKAAKRRIRRKKRLNKGKGN